MIFDQQLKIMKSETPQVSARAATMRSNIGEKLRNSSHALHEKVLAPSTKAMKNGASKAGAAIKGKIEKNS